MPLEGHWERTHTPVRELGIRELRIVYVVGAMVAVCAVIGLILILSPQSEPSVSPGCIDALVPGIMGGGHVDPCGRRAVRLCASQVGHDDAYARPILASCRKQGLLPRG